MEINGTRMCELLVGSPDVNVLAVDDQPDRPIVVHIEARRGPVWCRGCDGPARVKDRSAVELIDLPCSGRPSRLVWRKHRWRCPDPACPTGSWTIIDARIAAPRATLTDRAGRRVTVQVGRLGRSVSEIADELGCDWHTVHDTVVAYGEALLAASVASATGAPPNATVVASAAPIILRFHPIVDPPVRELSRVSPPPRLASPENPGRKSWRARQPRRTGGRSNRGTASRGSTAGARRRAPAVAPSGDGAMPERSRPPAAAGQHGP